MSTGFISIHDHENPDRATVLAADGPEQVKVTVECRKADADVAARRSGNILIALAGCTVVKHVDYREGAE